MITVFRNSKIIFVVYFYLFIENVRANTSVKNELQEYNVYRYLHAVLGYLIKKVNI